MPRRKNAKGKKAKVKHFPVRSLTAKDASKVKGGLNPQPEPPMPEGFLKINTQFANPLPQTPDVKLGKF